MAQTPNAYVVVVVESTDAVATINPKIAPAPPGRLPDKLGIVQVAKYLERIAGGLSAGKVTVEVQSTTGWTAASGTVAIVVASAPSDGDTVVINGTTFTFKTTPDVTNQFQVAIGADGAASITNLNAAIAAIPWFSQLMTGAITGTTTKTLTLTATTKGSWGNSMTITRVGAAITVGTFASGTNGTTAPSYTAGGFAVYQAGG